MHLNRGLMPKMLILSWVPVQETSFALKAKLLYRPRSATTPIGLREKSCCHGIRNGHTLTSNSCNITPRHDDVQISRTQTVCCDKESWRSSRLTDLCLVAVQFMKQHNRWARRWVLVRSPKIHPSLPVRLLEDRASGIPATEMRTTLTIIFTDHIHRNRLDTSLTNWRFEQKANLSMLHSVSRWLRLDSGNDPHKRLRQHRHHESSNYLINSAKAVFALEYPDSFRLQQNIVFFFYQPIHTWSGEIVVTQLAQGCVQEE